MDRDRIRLRVRAHGGRLAPLEGPARAIPDSLLLRAALSTRVGIFNVGASELVADVTRHRSAGKHEFTARFRREPEWHFPLLVERLIRGPLRRPFEGDGASLRLSARSSAGRTTLVRDYQLVVHESAIVRWVGGLGSTVVTDFRSGAERESDRFYGELFSALRADARHLIR